MSRRVSPNDPEESFFEKHLGLTLSLSVLLHVFIGWLFLLVLPNLLEAGREESKEEVIIVQIDDDRNPPLPVNPTDIGQAETTAETKAAESPAADEAVKVKPTENPAADEVVKVKPTENPAADEVVKVKPTESPAADEVVKVKPLNDQTAEAKAANEAAVQAALLKLAESLRQKDQQGGSTTGEKVDRRKMAYYKNLRDIVVSNWVTPPSYSVGNHLDYQLTILPDGRISGLNPKSSSGDPELDTSLVRAINKSDPLPPLPEVFENQPETVILRFDPEDVRRLQRQQQGL